MDEEDGAVAPANADEIQPARLNATVQAQNVHISGGFFASAGRDVNHHTHYHFHEAPNLEGRQSSLLSALELVDNFRGIHQDNLGKATPKTGEWMFVNDMFIAWRNPERNVNTLWGSGIPGAGKTVMTSIVVNGIEKWAEEYGSPICVCYIYIRYSDNAGLTVRHCLEVFVKQAIEKHPECLMLAEKAYANHIQVKTRPTEEELLQLLASFTTVVAAMFFFLDALDEAPPEIQFSLVEKLSSLKGKLFITSRPLTILQERFPNAHHFPIVAQETDLDLHIESKLNNGASALYKVLEEGGSELRAEIATAIKRNCGGMFLHASLQLATLQYCASIYDVRETLANFPPKIEDVYRDTWRRIVAKASESKGVRAENCVIWVLNAPKSMTVTELQHAAAVCLETHKFDPNRLVHQDTLVALCLGLLVVDQETSMVRLVHYTAKEILEHLIVETFPQLHSLMASLCMSRLVEHGLQNWKGDEDDLGDAMAGDPILLPYAYHAWANHARNSLDEPSTAAEVADFVQGCRAFPLPRGRKEWYIKHYQKPDLLGPLHVVAFFNLPLSLAGSDLKNALRLTSRTPLDKDTPLHLVCRHASDLSTARELLSSRLVDVNAANSRKETPLIRAIRTGGIAAAKLLLAHPKIRLDPRDSQGCTAFTWAARYGNEAMVNAILAHSPAEIHATDKWGRTALSWACQHGHFGTVKLLLSHSTLEARVADNDGRTPLIWASMSRCIRILKLILSSASDDAHTVDKDGRTPLSWAASCGDLEAIATLLAVPGTNVNQRDKSGCTPLIWASMWIPHYPPFWSHDTDGDGDLPLSWPSLGFSASEQVARVQALLAHPEANVNTPDNHGMTPLSTACESCTQKPTHIIPILSLLLTHPAIDVNFPDHRKGRTPLHWALVDAAPVQDDSKVRLLLSHPNIDVNVQQLKDGRTPLSLAAYSGLYIATQSLLNHPQIDVNLPDKEGRTPLIRIASKKPEYLDSDVVKAAEALLAHPKIEVNATDNSGRTALSWALKKGHDDLVELLLAHPHINPTPDHSLDGPLDSAVRKVRSLLG